MGRIAVTYEVENNEELTFMEKVIAAIGHDNLDDPNGNFSRPERIVASIFKYKVDGLEKGERKECLGVRIERIFACQICGGVKVDGVWLDVVEESFFQTAGPNNCADWSNCVCIRGWKDVPDLGYSIKIKYVNTFRHPQGEITMRLKRFELIPEADGIPQYPINVMLEGAPAILATIADWDYPKHGVLITNTSPDNYVMTINNKSYKLVSNDTGDKNARIWIVKEIKSKK